nr:L,D-transpeptidase family protein [Alkalilimnicola sp. S0819]
MLQRLIMLAALVVSGLAPAAEYSLPPDDVNIIGRLQWVEASEEDTLIDIGLRHGVGYEEIVAANPDVDPFLPGAGTQVLLPTRYILPSGPREGLVLNLAELRIYYYPPAQRGKPRTVETYPVGIGRMDWQTPLGETRITAKIEDPVWYPPASIRAEARAQGEEMPRQVPAGPDNPLGRHAMTLGLPGYLIHGTNRPMGVGMRVSHGCVRMMPEHIESLIYRVSVDTPVRIVDERYKVGWFAGQLYLEAHPAPDGQVIEAGSAEQAAFAKIAQQLSARPHRVDTTRVREALGHSRGVPVPISRDGMVLAAGPR